MALDVVDPVSSSSSSSSVSSSSSSSLSSSSSSSSSLLVLNADVLIAVDGVVLDLIADEGTDLLA